MFDDLKTLAKAAWISLQFLIVTSVAGFLVYLFCKAVGIIP